MLVKTHFLFGVLLAFAFAPYIEKQVLFLAVVLISSVLADADFSNSFVGRGILFRPLQFFVQHRGILHNLLFCAGVSALLSFFIPILAFPFFLGYSGHLILDGISTNGLRVFWPFKAEVKGFISTGGYGEKVLSIGIILLIVLFSLRLIV